LKNYEEKQARRLKQSKIVLFAGIILVIISPYLLTRNFDLISFDNTGQIGDTIGGITAPIVNLIGAILVYFAFLVQLDANKLIFQQIKDQKKEQKIDQNRTYIFELYKQLKDDLYSFSILREEKIGFKQTEQSVMIEYKGLEAIDKMLSNIMSDHKGFGRGSYKLIEFKSIIELYNKFLTNLKEININQIDKKFFLESVEYMYNSKIKASIIELIKPCESCGEVHDGDPNKLFELSEYIENSIREIKENYAKKT